MITWGIVFIGLWLILADVHAVAKVKLMGNLMLIRAIVIGSGLAIHGGSADGAMAAIVRGCFSALYVRWQQRMHGYIRRGMACRCTAQSRSPCGSDAMSADLYATTTARIIEAPRGKVYPLLRSFTVFNVAQTEGLSPRYTEPSVRTWVPEAKAEELLLMSGARFRTGAPERSTSRSSDCARI